VLLIREVGPCSQVEVTPDVSNSVHVAFAPEEGNPCSSDHVSLGRGPVNRHRQAGLLLTRA
jgi:hypothetical protein